jgi:hypothetical protein
MKIAINTLVLFAFTILVSACNGGDSAPIQTPPVSQTNSGTFSQEDRASEGGASGDTAGIAETGVTATGSNDVTGTTGQSGEPIKPID